MFEGERGRIDDEFCERARHLFEAGEVAIFALGCRGLVHDFDTDPGFAEPGAHARVVETLLARAGLAGARLDDAWVPRKGWRISARLPGRKARGLTFTSAEGTSRKTPSDLAD